jgi:hypothetical protein
VIESEKLVSNKIRTPDGTILQSHHRHDYKSYTDKNGKDYMVDGGLEYLRRIVHDDAPYQELSATLTDPFETIRESFCWGTRGKEGKDPVKWVELMNLETDHIQAILDTQFDSGRASWVKELMEKELEFRKALT